jgi:hypothetical protein
MKKLTLVIAIFAALSASAQLAQPTPRATQKPIEGPTLDITFSGAVLFLKTPTGYKAIVAQHKAAEHQAYLRYLKSDVARNSFGGAKTFQCEGGEYQWAPLDGNQLTLDPMSALATSGPLDASGIDGWLVHLGDLAKNNKLDEAKFNRSRPNKSTVAAQMNLDRGSLLPLVLNPPYHPVKWDFQANGARANVQICGTSGIRWLLPLKAGTRSISLVTAEGPKLTLALADGRTTALVIGNSLIKDIECPTEEPQSVDKHFALHYKLLKTPVEKQFVPVRIKPEVKCPPPEAKSSGSRSARGSDCLGTQWP